MTMSKKCLICEQRPAPQDRPYCKLCWDQVQAETRRRKAEVPSWFLTYKGHVVGLYPNGDDRLTPRLLKKNAEKLPKGKTINLNVYQAGYTRDQIKKFKRAVLRLASVTVVKVK